jgi:hypothetical protein
MRPSGSSSASAGGPGRSVPRRRCPCRYHARPPPSSPSSRGTIVDSKGRPTAADVPERQTSPWLTPAGEARLAELTAAPAAPRSRP